MEKMQAIRDRFILKIEQRTKEALGIHVLLMSSRNFFGQDHNRIFLGNGPPEKGDYIKYVPTIGEIRKALKDREYMVLELFLADMIQTWYDFQNNLFKWLVCDSQSKRKRWLIKPVPKPTLSPGASESEALEAYLVWFDRENAKVKFKLLSNALDASVDEDLINRLKQYVSKRNILQHNEGIIRQHDVHFMGGVFTSIYDRKKRQLRVGDRLDITPEDMEDLADTLIEVAKCLVQ